jgi:cobalamin synthase
MNKEHVDAADWSQYQNDRCWIGNQALVVFSSCLCGITGSLLSSNITLLSFCICSGITIPSLETVSSRYLSSREFLLSCISTYAVVYLVCSLLLDIKDLLTVVLSSVVSSAVVSAGKAWSPRLLEGIQGSTVGTRTTDSDICENNKDNNV